MNTNNFHYEVNYDLISASNELYKIFDELGQTTLQVPNFSLATELKMDARGILNDVVTVVDPVIGIFQIPWMTVGYCEHLLEKQRKCSYAVDELEGGSYQIPLIETKHKIPELYWLLGNKFMNEMKWIVYALYNMSINNFDSIEFTRYRQDDFKKGSWHFDNSDVTITTPINEFTGGELTIQGQGAYDGCEVTHSYGSIGVSTLFPGGDKLHRGEEITSEEKNLLTIFAKR